MAERKKPTDPMMALQKATTIGGPRAPMDRRPAVLRAPTQMEKTLDNPSGLVPMAGMIGGLPEGLNPGIIQQLLKQVGVDFAEEAPAMVDKLPAEFGSGAFSPVSSAQDVKKTVPQGAEEAVMKYLKKFVGGGQ